MSQSVWCDDICRYSQHCMHGKKEIGKDPEKCLEYYKLEDYEWDAYQDRIAEAREYDRDCDEDEDDEED